MAAQIVTLATIVGGLCAVLRLKNLVTATEVDAVIVAVGAVMEAEFEPALVKDAIATVRASMDSFLRHGRPLQ